MNPVGMSSNQEAEPLRHLASVQNTVNSDGITSSLAKDVANYGNETTLHGLKYICQPGRHSCEKIFWTVSFVSSIVLAGFLVYGVCISYLKNPVVVTYQVEETEIHSIPFPAVTICNTNRIRKSVAMNYLNTAKESLQFLSSSTNLSKNQTELEETVEKLKVDLMKVKCVDYICRVPSPLGSPHPVESENNSLYNLLVSEKNLLHNFSVLNEITFNEDDVTDVRLLGRRNCDEIAMAIYCEWNGRKVNCCDIFEGANMGTDDGVCFDFNGIVALYTEVNTDQMFINAAKKAPWSADTAEWESFLNFPAIELQRRAGRELQNIGQIRTQNRGGRADGLTVVLNPELNEYFCSPNNGAGFFLKTHNPLDSPKMHSKSLPLSPGMEAFVSLTPKATFADPDIKWFGVENRRCYFSQEYRLEVLKTYTKNNCIFECQERLIAERCGCRNFYLELKGSPPNFCTSSSEEQKCVLDVKTSFLTKPLSEQCPHCLPTCNDIEYIESITTSQISDQNTKYHTGASREYYQKWINQSFSILHVYFQDDSFFARQRKQLYSLSDLIANIGGLLGLCLGFSGLSLVELGYFFCIRPCFKRQDDNV